MKCIACGRDLTDDGRYCPQCGSRREEIIRRIKNFPPDLKELVDGIMGALEYHQSKSEDSQYTGEKTIMAMEDVKDIPSDFKGKIYTAGSVTFAPSQSYKVELRYDNAHVQTAAFKSTAIIYRETGNDGSIDILTDQGDYHIGDEKLGQWQRRNISRSPIIIVKYSDDLYVYCNKGGNYLNIENKSIPSHAINNVNLFQAININGKASITIRD